MFRIFIPPLPITGGHHAMAWTCPLNGGKFSLGGETRRERRGGFNIYPPI